MNIGVALSLLTMLGGGVHPVEAPPAPQYAETASIENLPIHAKPLSTSRVIGTVKADCAAFFPQDEIRASDGVWFPVNGGGWVQYDPARGFCGPAAVKGQWK